MVRDVIPDRTSVTNASDCLRRSASVTIEVQDENLANDVNLFWFAPSITVPTRLFEPHQYWHALAPTYLIAMFDSPATMPRMHSCVEETLYPEWLTLSYGGQDSLTIAELGRLVDGITEDLYRRNFGLIDRTLDLAQPVRMSADAIVAIARVTYSAKDLLPHWPTFVGRSKEVLINRGQSEKILAGL